MTNGGVEYDLKISRFTEEIDGIKFFFSSEMHRRKFRERVQSNRKKISESLQDRFNLFITANQLADIVLYTKIETRGFLIEYEGVKLWEKNLKLNTVILTKKDFNEPLQTSTQNVGG